MSAPILTLSNPVGSVSAVQILALWPADGATGSITFNALDAAGDVVPPTARGAVFVSPLVDLPTEADVQAAIIAALDPK